MDLIKFGKIVKDFIFDIDHVFPEYKIFNKEIYKDLYENENENENENVSIKKIFEHCKLTFPKHFFDILYKNDKIFETEQYLLPEISFKNIWETEISEETKTKIWQYLQLILICITEHIDNSSDFGDATQLFDLLDENDFREKLSDTFEELTNAFKNDISGIDLEDKNLEDISYVNEFMDGAFNPEKMHEHISKLLNGKIGSLAKEIAGDTLNELGIDSSNSDTTSVFESLIKDPSKLMSLMKKIGDKIETKIKTGELNKDELMSEASELFKNMKDMPGFEDMFNKMAKSHVGRKGGKVPSMNSMEAMLEKNMKASKQRKKMLERLQDKQAQSQSQSQSQLEGLNIDLDNVNVSLTNNETDKKESIYTDEEIIKSFMENVVDPQNKKPPSSKKKKKKKK